MADFTKVYCNSCRTATKHEVMATAERSGTNDDEVSFQGEFETLSCAGCETVTYRTTWTNSDDIDWNTGEAIPSVELYLPRIQARKQPARTPRFFKHAAKEVHDLYEETVNAFGLGLDTLAGAGIRATVECLCINHGVKKGSVRIVVQKADALT